MSEQAASTVYTVTLADRNDVISQCIDVRPPIITTEHYLRYCGNMFGVSLEHFVTTANTTRLIATSQDEELGHQEQAEAFQKTADFIARTLTMVDAGEDHLRA